jgi:hypothetical protein
MANYLMTTSKDPVALEKEEAKLFDKWFTEILFKTCSCFERDVLRGCKKDLFIEWLRLANGGKPKEIKTRFKNHDEYLAYFKKV